MNSQENVAGVKTRSMKVCDNMVEITAKRVYCHISKAKKTQLVQTVLKQKCKIKKIAKDLNINYATAKTILHCYKKKEINLNDDSQQKGLVIVLQRMTLNYMSKLGKGKIINHYEYFDVIKRHQ